MLRPGELKRVCLWSALLVVLILLPYPFAGAFRGAGWHFMGHLYAVDEGNAYLAWSRQAAEGAWRFKNLYTPVHDKQLFFNAFLLAVGKAAALLHVEPIVAYHLARPLCGWACLVSVYLLAAFIFPDSLTRWSAFSLAALSSGFGWAVHLVRSNTGLHPLDFGEGLIQPEAITFLCIFVNPLFAASLALMCLVFLTFLMGVHQGRDVWIVVAGALHLLLGNIHTYDIFVVNGALALYLVLLLASWAIALSHAVYAYALFLVISAASPLYQLYVVAADPLYAAKAATVTASGSIVDHTLTYGLVLVLALVGTAWAARRPDSRTVFLLAWLVVGVLMPFAPTQFFPFQRKMWEGFHVVLSLLAAAACAQVLLPRIIGASSAPRRTGAVLIAGLVALTFPSNFFFVRQAMRDAADNNARLTKNLMPPIYLSDNEVRALHWLRDNTGPDDVVLSLPYLGNHIPAVSGNRVYMGHWAETIRFRSAVSAVLRLYSPESDVRFCTHVMRRARIRYVYCGVRERTLSPSAKPAFLKVRGVSEAFVTGDVTIYRVSRQGSYVQSSILAETSVLPAARVARQD